MKTLYLDCAMGAAGDMLAGALLELMPDPAAALAELNAFGIPGVAYVRETLSKCGLAATHLSVTIAGYEESEAHHSREHHHAHRALADVLQVVGRLNLEPSVREDVKSVYESLAAAESRAHGRDVGEIHFHEVGALDAIADIAAFCHLLRRLAPDRVVGRRTLHADGRRAAEAVRRCVRPPAADDCPKDWIRRRPKGLPARECRPCNAGRERGGRVGRRGDIRTQF